MIERDRILVVEHEKATQDLIRSYLATSRYPMDVAATLADARELALQHNYSVVIVEALLPECSGLRVIADIQPRQPTATFLLLADTVMSDKQLLSLPTEDKAAEHIAQILFKPLDDKQLLRALELAVLARHQRAAEDHANQLAQKARQTSPQHSAAYTLLVIEDDELDAALVRRTISTATCCKFATKVVERLSEGIALLAAQHFDAVLTDLSLPDARGLTTVSILREATSAPVIVLSGVEDTLIALQTIQLGAQDFIPKGPRDPRDVIQRIRFAIERSRTLANLTHLAWHHPLTQLPNRTLFRERLGEALKRARRNKSKVGVLFIDLDGFKAVNDTLGHDTGDQVLLEAAKRLQQSCRESDTAAHLGGDEFALLLDSVGTAEDVTRVAQRIVAELSAPMAFLRAGPVISASVGIACSEDDKDEDVESLTRRADVAMYKAKRLGKNQARAWSVSLLSEMANYAALASSTPASK